ncbi:MAG TPA: cupin domain-containing protein [Anaerolineales bacterium]|nr:cupin domain-containing protein [Anaerolineales bacterium]
MSSIVSIDELANLLTVPFMHLEVGQVNDHAAYLLQFKGESHWHRHTQDEMYIVLEGEVQIEFHNQPTAVLKKHDTVVVRAYTTHNPKSQNGALVLMFKPKEMFQVHDMELGG